MGEEEEVQGTGEVALLDEQRGADMVYAARQGDLEAVKQALDDGVPVGFRDNGGWTALRWAASEGREEVLAVLLENGAADDEVETASSSAEEGSGGASSLHWAAYKGHVRIVWRLLTCTPPLNPKVLDTECNTPLHLAASSGHLLILQTLLSQGVDVSLKNSYGNMAGQVSTSKECQALLKEAASAALEGRPYLCSCSGEFCSEAGSAAEKVIDKVSSPNVRPVRYSSECLGEIRAAEDGLTQAMKASEANEANVEVLDTAIARAEKIMASLPLITEAIAGLERMRAEIALAEAVATLQGLRPLKDKAMVRPMAAPLKQAREKGVSEAITDDAEALCTTVDAEVAIFDQIAVCAPYKMVSEAEEGEAEEPPSAESDFAKRAEGMITKLAGAIHDAQTVDAMAEVVDLGETELAHLTAESELRKALLPPKEGVSEDGTPCQTQHNGSKTYSALEDLQFRTDFLDASLDKCVAAGTVEPLILFAQKVQKDMKVALKAAQIEDEDRKAKEAAAAAKAAKKGKKKK